MGLSILLGLSLYKTSVALKKKSILCLLAPLVASIFPYVEGRGDVFSNMHEVCAYLSLGLILYVTYFNIINYRMYSLKKSNYCLKILGITMFIDTIYYFDSFRVYSIHELILLSVIILIHLFIYYDVKKRINVLSYLGIPEWRNGRRARLKIVLETVWVQVPLWGPF